MDTKVCNKCGMEKPLSEYELRTDTGKYRNTCRECKKNYLKGWYKDNRSKVIEYRSNNKEEISKKAKKYYEKNKEHILKQKKEYRENNAEMISAKLKEWRKNHKQEISEYNKKYNLDNKDKILDYKKEYHKLNRANENEYAKKRHAERKVSDQKYVLRIRIRNMIKHSFERQGYSKNSHTYSILGTDYETFYNHLLKSFYDNYGYAWDGKEEVHIDHIIPLATAKTEDEVIKLCHYTNLQLLKGEDNLSKGDRLDWNLHE